MRRCREPAQLIQSSARLSGSEPRPAAYFRGRLASSRASAGKPSEGVYCVLGSWCQLHRGGVSEALRGCARPRGTRWPGGTNQSFCAANLEVLNRDRVRPSCGGCSRFAARVVDRNMTKRVAPNGVGRFDIVGNIVGVAASAGSFITSPRCAAASAALGGSHK